MIYDDPALHLNTRGPVSPDLVAGMEPANRAVWGDTPHFLGWPAQLQRVHATLTEASARLASGLEVLLDEPEGGAQELLGVLGMNRLGLDLLDRVAHHHNYEDTDVLPRFLSHFPAMAESVDLLERDHDVLHGVLDRARQSFQTLRPHHSRKTDIATARDAAAHLRRVLHRHTHDEEDLLIPAILRTKAVF